MFRFLMRLICLGLLLLAGFFALSLMSGGDSFRRFGDTVKEKSEQVGETADVIKNTVEDIRGSVSETVQTIKRTGSKLIGITAGTTEKAGEKLKTTGEKIQALTSDGPDDKEPVQETDKTDKAAATDNDKDP